MAEHFLVVDERWDVADWGVTQTVLYTPESAALGVQGNCLQAAVASLLKMPLDAVPHFSAFLWWIGAAELWARGLHPALTFRSAKVEGVDDIPLFRHILCGPSPRGVSHSVIAEEGRVVWDPHPTRAGLTGVTDAYWFEPLADHPDEGKHCPLCRSE